MSAMLATEAKDRPILFSGEMVRAILDGRKTQTRRVAKGHRGYSLAASEWVERNDGYACGLKGEWWAFKRELNQKHRFFGQRLACNTIAVDTVYCPYGQPGDRLWVKESFAACVTGIDDLCIWYADDSCFALSAANGDVPDGGLSTYFRMVDRSAKNDGRSIKQSSRFMPRWASRLTLEIVSVRVERVQEISEADAKAEGMTRAGRCQHCQSKQIAPYVCEYRELWDSLNAKRGFGWDVNPWVWVIEFRKV